MPEIISNKGRLYMYMAILYKWDWEGKGRVPFNQNFQKFQFKVEWNKRLPEIRFKNFGQPLKV